MIVDVFILNYNGAHFLSRCLESVLASRTDGISLSVVVADNGSTDNSADVVRQYPDAQWLPLGGNLGYVRGNNEAVRLRLAARAAQNLPQPNVLIFLNNDVEVAKDWLVSLLSPIAHDDIGIVGAKSLFLDPFVPLRVDSETVTNQKEQALLKTSLSVEGGSHPSLSYPGRIKPLGPTLSSDGISWTIGDKVTFLIPAHVDIPTAIHLRLACAPGASPCRLSFSVDGHALGEQTLLASQTTEISLEIPPGYARRFIQNAGTFIERKFVVGDRGFLQEDKGQFASQENISAVCGVSLAIRCSLFKKLGGFSEDFVSYYEDVDLSLRARLLGFRCVYNPRAVINHVHAGSGIEGSEYFTRTVAESRTMFLSKYSGPIQFWGRVGKEMAIACREISLPPNNARPHTQALFACAAKARAIVRNRLLYWAKGYFWRIPKLIGRV